MTALQIQALTGNRSVQSWYEDPEFVAWFLAKDSTKVMIDYGVEVAVRELIAILDEPEMGPRSPVTAAAKVAAAKTLLEMSDLAPTKKREIIFRDKDISEMDEAELREFIQSKNKALKLVD
jgi:hypothetical protein